MAAHSRGHMRVRSLRRATIIRMAKKKAVVRKMPKKVTTIEGLAELMTGEFSRVDKTIEGLAELMTSKFSRVDERLERIEDQIVSINGELRGIRTEIKEINRRLDTLEAGQKDMRGYAVEIDELRARVTQMEQFLKSQGMKMPAR